MKKLNNAIFCSLLTIAGTISAASLGSCSKEEPKTEDATITVTDMVGDTLTIKKNPKKVACPSRTTFDLLIAYGLGDKIDGAYKGTLNNPWAAEIYPASSNIYSLEYQESYETYITRGVDLVFSPEKYITDELKEHGIPAMTVSLYGNPSFDNYVTWFSDMVSTLWDDASVKTKSQAWNAKVTTAIDEVKETIKDHKEDGKKVFYVRGDKDKGIGYTDTVGSFTEYAYRVMGFDYVGSTLESNKPSNEEVIASNPDIFVCGGVYQNTNIEKLKTEPFSNLDAVKNNKVYNIPIGLTAFEQLSAMTPIFFYDQAQKIYPTLFNYDINKLVKETIAEYFGTELTDQKIDYMLKGLSPTGGSMV